MDESTIKLIVEVVVLALGGYAALNKMFDKQATRLGERIDGVRDELSNQLNGVRTELTSHRLSTSTDINSLRADVVGIRTTLVGVDGQNGVRSEVRELKKEMHQIHDAVVHIDNRVSVLESKDGD